MLLQKAEGENQTFTKKLNLFNLFGYRLFLSLLYPYKCNMYLYLIPNAGRTHLVINKPLFSINPQIIALSNAY